MLHEQGRVMLGGKGLPSHCIPSTSSFEGRMCTCWCFSGSVQDEFVSVGTRLLDAQCLERIYAASAVSRYRHGRQRDQGQNDGHAYEHGNVARLDFE